MKNILEKSWTVNILTTISLLLFWEICFYTAAEPIIFPSLQNIFIAAIEIFQTKNFWLSYMHTMVTLLVAWLLNCFLICIVIFLCMISNIFRKIFTRYCSYFMPLPSFVLIPFLLLFFGFSQITVLSAMILGAFWSISFQILSAFDTVKQQWNKHAINLKWNTWTTITKIYIPAIAPQLIAISSMGWIYMWRVLITLEVAYGAIGGYFGMGSYLISLKSTLDIDRMYVVLFLVAITGVTINAMLEKIALKVRW
jgi:NitT/TauT family transport system permease protein